MLYDIVQLRVRVLKGMGAINFPGGELDASGLSLLPRDMGIDTSFKGRRILWRGGLPPLERAAALKPAIAVFQIERIRRFYDCCAAERGQAPSPQYSAALKDIFHSGYLSRTDD
ncbi:hypothetical protein PS723_04917 [Pseudomonas fluorescens]|uniref:Uncharacterized protein n=1 Tax=Pseudomonas fluorescens TaxID=294 RepID=A0A5E7ET87_PSEFL|nr:hypothetical protein PS723_04917 [Pseudomonas fluorescens]